MQLGIFVSIYCFEFFFLLMMQGQPAFGVDGRTPKGMPHVIYLAGHVSTVAWQQTDHPRIYNAVGSRKGASNASAAHGHPLDAAPKVHVILWIAPAARRQIEIKTTWKYETGHQTSITHICNYTHDSNKPLLIIYIYIYFSCRRSVAQK